MTCRLCGSSNLTLYYTQGNNNQFHFYKCNNCKLVNYDLSGGQDQMKYTGETYISPEDNSKKQNIDQAETYYFIDKHISKKGRLLDIGCGNGKILTLASKDGWDVKGLELSPFLASSINNKYGFDVDVVDFLDYKPKEGEKYDVVILRHVLEHLPDSVLAMNKINALLNNGGYGVLEFPDIESMQFKIKRFLNKIGLLNKKYKPSYIPGHCNEFSRESFRYLLDKTGFKLLLWENYSSKNRLKFLYKTLSFGTKARALIEKKFS